MNVVRASGVRSVGGLRTRAERREEQRTSRHRAVQGQAVIVSMNSSLFMST
jgi:hypothetical protein